MPSPPMYFDARIPSYDVLYFKTKPVAVAIKRLAADNLRQAGKRLLQSFREKEIRGAGGTKPKGTWYFRTIA